MGQADEDRDLPVDDVVLAIGSSGTAGGVAIGVHLAGLPINARLGRRLTILKRAYVCAWLLCLRWLVSVSAGATRVCAQKRMSAHAFVLCWCGVVVFLQCSSMQCFRVTWFGVSVCQTVL